MPGTGFLAAEGTGDVLAVSLWLSLYGDDAAEIVARDTPLAGLGRVALIA